jgi:predicted RNA-binding protein associated with RNAse of E/G family
MTVTTGSATGVHRPKVEYFNLAELTNTDPKGFVRPVEKYRSEPWGLYMARQSDHPHFHYLESWLIPRLGIRVSVFHFFPLHDRDQNYYIDIGEFGMVGPKLWRAVDHYLDIVVRTGRETELLDVDELLAATVAGLVEQDAATRAIEHAATVIDGVARHRYRLEDWLESMGIALNWI